MSRFPGTFFPWLDRRAWGIACLLFAADVALAQAPPVPQGADPADPTTAEPIPSEQLPGEQAPDADPKPLGDGPEVDGAEAPKTEPADTEAPGNESAETEPDESGELPYPLPPGLLPVAGTEPVPLPDKLVLQAGRAIPPGLTAARVAERQRAAASAVEELSLGLAREDGRRARWLARLESILADVTGQRFDEELWLAAAGAAGALRSDALDQSLAGGLAPGSTARRRTAAQLALHSIHGVWFASPEDLDSYRAERGSGAVPGWFVERQRDLDRQNRAHLVRLLRYETDLAIASLAHADPRVRRAAARELGARAQSAPGADAGVDRSAVLEALFARLGEETWPDVLHEILESLDRLLGAQWPEGTDVGALRARLVEALESHAESPTPGIELSLAQALARVPWGIELASRVNASHGLELATQLLRELVGRPNPADPDVLVGVIGSMQALYDAGRADAGHAEIATAARLPILDLLQDAQRAVPVRLAAARAASTLAIERDATTLVDVLEQPGSPTELQYVLLSALRRLAKTVAPDGETAGRIADSVLSRVAHSDADVRRRALGLLADPDVRPLLRGRDPAPLVHRLGVEPIAELQGILLDLLRELGSPRELEALLALPEFELLAGGEPALAADLATTLGALAAGDPERTLRAAQRLASAGGEDAGMSRTLLALQLCARLGADAAAALGPAGHARVVDWAIAVRKVGVRLESAVSREFVERLVAIHLPSAQGFAESSAGDPARYHYYSALFLVDVRGDDATADADIERHFASALTAIAPADDPHFQPRVRRDRARFNDARDATALALSEYRVLFTWERDRWGPDAGPRESQTVVLELVDLRAAARLAAGVRKGAPEAGVASEAFELGSTLVHQAAWRSETDAVRLQDLRDLVQRAETSLDARSLTKLEDWLLPPAGDGASDATGTGDGGGSTTNAPQPIWGELDDDPSAAETLAGLRARVSAALEVLGGRTIEASAESKTSPPRELRGPSGPGGGGTPQNLPRGG